jgi:hypothetical protein
MNNNLLLQAQKWLAELGIRTEAAQTFLKINREDIRTCGLFEGHDENELTGNLLVELKNTVSKKLYFDKGCPVNYHLTSF